MRGTMRETFLRTERQGVFHEIDVDFTHLKCLRVISKRYLTGLTVRKCPCIQSINFASERDPDMKFQIHRKFYSKPIDFRQIRILRKAVMLREHQNNETEKMKRVHDHH